MERHLHDLSHHLSVSARNSLWLFRLQSSAQPRWRSCSSKPVRVYHQTTPFQVDRSERSASCLLMIVASRAFWADIDCIRGRLSPCSPSIGGRIVDARGVGSKSSRADARCCCVVGVRCVLWSLSAARAFLAGFLGGVESSPRSHLTGSIADGPRGHARSRRSATADAIAVDVAGRRAGRVIDVSV